VAALKQANPARCTECGHPVTPEAAGTICSECGEPVDKHRLSRLGVRRAMALYAASFVPIVVMAVLSGVLERRSNGFDINTGALLEQVTPLLSVAAGVGAVVGCTSVTALLFRKLPRRLRHTPALSVLPFIRMVVVCVIVAMASALIAPVLWVGACLGAAAA
jgi:predicted nucleic acid-binding Zn ribbon protein